jgi:hypothetical protein
MKRIQLVLALSVALTFATSSGAAQSSGEYVGTSAANFLKIGLGARAVGMGESAITQAEDAASLYWNPGAITHIGRPSAVFSSVQWFVETNVSYLAVTVPFDVGTFGIDVSYFGSGDIEETTLLRQDGTGRVVSASDIAVGLGYARDFTDRLSVGIKAKYIREELAAVSADGFAFDVGSVFTTSFLNDLKIGIALTNFGGSMQFNGRELLVSNTVPESPTNKAVPAVLQTSEWAIPMTFRFGVATDVFRWESSRITASYTITDSRDYGDRHNVGAEVMFNNLGGLATVALRGGYRFRYDEQTFSAGFGVGYNLETVGTLTVDYAYTDFGRLNAVHQFTFGILL